MFQNFFIVPELCIMTLYGVTKNELCNYLLYNCPLVKILIELSKTLVKILDSIIFRPVEMIVLTYGRMNEIVINQQCNIQ